MKVKDGIWSLTELMFYLKFLKRFRRTFESSRAMRKAKIYETMALEIGSRSTQQCTSHHQKMVKKYGGVQKILEHFERPKMVLSEDLGS